MISAFLCTKKEGFLAFIFFRGFFKIPFFIKINEQVYKPGSVSNGYLSETFDYSKVQAILSGSVEQT